MQAIFKKNYFIPATYGYPDLFFASGEKYEVIEIIYNQAVILRNKIRVAIPLTHLKTISKNHCGFNLDINKVNVGDTIDFQFLVIKVISNKTVINKNIIQGNSLILECVKDLNLNEISIKKGDSLYYTSKGVIKKEV